jgi:branched-chain amino acid transport system ATP-binding protein
MSARDPHAPLLELRDVVAGYGTSRVLNGFSMSVERSRIIAILGPNGAGKSTLLNTICGLTRVSGGSVWFEGKDVTGWPAYRIVRSGVGYSPQGRRLFPYLSVEANLALGAYPRTDRAQVHADVERFLERWPVIEARRDRPAGLLSGGEQQIVALGRALIGNPTLLMLDEPSLGLAPVLVGELYKVLDDLAREGAPTLLIVEQNVANALRIADEVYVLVNGRIVAAAPADQLDPEDIARLYFAGVEPGHPVHGEGAQ